MAALDMVPPGKLPGIIRAEEVNSSEKRRFCLRAIGCDCVCATAVDDLTSGRNGSEAAGYALGLRVATMTALMVCIRFSA